MGWLLLLCSHSIFLPLSFHTICENSEDYLSDERVAISDVKIDFIQILFLIINRNGEG